MILFCEKCDSERFTIARRKHEITVNVYTVLVCNNCKTEYELFIS